MANRRREGGEADTMELKPATERSRAESLSVDALVIATLHGSESCLSRYNRANRRSRARIVYVKLAEDSGSKTMIAVLHEQLQAAVEKRLGKKPKAPRRIMRPTEEPIKKKKDLAPTTCTQVKAGPNANPRIDSEMSRGGTRHRAYLQFRIWGDESMNKDIDFGGPETFKMVTLKEFAELMKVCPNTVRAWIEKGRLQEGKHFFEEERIIRFPWGAKLVKDLMTEWMPPHLLKPKTYSTRINRRKIKYRA